MEKYLASKVASRADLFHRVGMISLADDHGAAEEEVDIVAETYYAFAEGGALSTSKQFEYRPQQQRLASEIAETLVTETSIVAEAGTGVGKSLAYLIPSIKYALKSGKKCLLSTHTINLQEQLLHKDVPLAARLLGVPLRYTLLKGRQNYLCPVRLTRALQGKGDLFTSSEAMELKRIYDWSQGTEDGTLSDLDFKPSYKVWQQVCSDPDLGSQKRCGPSGRCHYQEARKRANDSQVVILNHNLFFSLLDIEQDSDAEGFLFARDFAVFDEAHTIENVAAKQLGLNISAGGMRAELNKIFNTRSKKGLLQKAQRLDLAQHVEEATAQVGHFFDNVTEALFPDGEHLTGQRMPGEVRVNDPDLVPNTIGAPLQRLRLSLGELSEETEDEMLTAELTETLRRLGDMQTGVAQFLDMEDEQAVYWAEPARGDYGSMTLRSAPIDIADRLRTVLFTRKRSAIMTSATLAVGSEDLGYFKRRVGAEHSSELMVGSPFDLRRQMQTYVASGMCEPKSRDYSTELTTWILAFLQYCGGRAFILFTSYRDMTLVAEQVRRLCDQQGWECFVQGQGQPRQAMLEGFRNAQNGVLLGTDSFWTGVDVPGDSLSNVIIARLPFEVPSHPVVQARLEDIEQKGGNPFMDYSLPEAVLKFRQGIGRLIRSGKDQGKIFLLDSRIVTKRYGQTFLDCVHPAPVKHLQTVHDLHR